MIARVADKAWHSIMLFTWIILTVISGWLNKDGFYILFSGCALGTLSSITTCLVLKNEK